MVDLPNKGQFNNELNNGNHKTVTVCERIVYVFDMACDDERAREQENQYIYVCLCAYVYVRVYVGVCLCLRARAHTCLRTWIYE